MKKIVKVVSDSRNISILIYTLFILVFFVLRIAVILNFLMKIKNTQLCK